MRPEMTINEAAKRYDISKSTIYNLISEKKFVKHVTSTPQDTKLDRALCDAFWKTKKKNRAAYGSKKPKVIQMPLEAHLSESIKLGSISFSAEQVLHLLKAAGV